VRQTEFPSPCDTQTPSVLPARVLSITELFCCMVTDVKILRVLTGIV
jgi:hypothetical protein